MSAAKSKGRRPGRPRRKKARPARARSSPDPGPPRSSPEGTGTRLVLRTDGAARGNPGPSAAGVVIERAGGEVVARLGRLLGHGTNNEAEYRAVIIALEEARKLGAEEVEVRTDSQLVAMQLLGRYQVKAAKLKPFFEKARSLLRGFRRSDVRHVPRAENREADRLAGRALDGYSDVDERGEKA
ncbi:MAG: ribonuclease HI family protein [Planctomycetota bacterium]